MPTQVLPITDLASVGLVMDTPSVSLPPNAFSDCQNVRFHDGAVRKMTGEAPLLSGSDFLYTAYWPSTMGDRYVTVDRTGTVNVHNPSGSVLYNISNQIAVGTNPEWQHTLFNGGFQLILNNGTGTPLFVDVNGNSGFLPGWDSYAAEREILNFNLDGSAQDITITNDLIIADAIITITSTPRNVASPVRTGRFTVNADDTVSPDGTVAQVGTISAVDVANNTIILTPAVVNGGNHVQVSIRLPAVATVTAGVVRSYGNLLVAGNLRESQVDGTVVRELRGLVRTSDVAAPGELPSNWNPFNRGVNTADEFTLAGTGQIQDMAELQGVMYVYTTDSIHSIQNTGNALVPFSTGVVTRNYGAETLGAVLEVDGKHIVCGSNDVYVFAGHPGSIKSIADGKVRYSGFFDGGTRITRFHKYDELWFWKPNSNEQYTWNYRKNIWSRRSHTIAGTDLVSLTEGPDSPIITRRRPIQGSVAEGSVVTSDNEMVYLPDSYIERRRFVMTPEFDTETLASMAIVSEGTGMFDIFVVGTDAPGEVTNTIATAGSFNIPDEYKHDIRVHGRLLNYRIEHTTTGNFVLSGLQFDISKGGTR